MNKTFKVYGIIWLICFGLMNVIVFVGPSENKDFGSFWVGYIFVVLAFIGQLFCSYLLLREEEAKLFYSVPFVIMSYIGLVIMLFVGAVPIFYPHFPMWASIIICLSVLCVSAIVVISSISAGKIAFGIGRRVKTATFTIRMLSSEAEHLMAQTQNAELRAEAKRVYEAIRYSDAMSNYALNEVNERLQAQFSTFREAVIMEDVELSMATSNEFLVILDERNKKCKMMK